MVISKVIIEISTKFWLRMVLSIWKITLNFDDILNNNMMPIIGFLLFIHIAEAVVKEHDGMGLFSCLMGSEIAVLYWTFEFDRFCRARPICVIIIDDVQCVLCIKINKNTKFPNDTDSILIFLCVIQKNSSVKWWWPWKGPLGLLMECRSKLFLLWFV